MFKELLLPKESLIEKLVFLYISNQPILTHSILIYLFSKIFLRYCSFDFLFFKNQPKFLLIRLEKLVFLTNILAILLLQDKFEFSVKILAGFNNISLLFISLFFVFSFC